MAASVVEIIGGDHDPPYPFIIIERQGLHVDLTGFTHELFDPATVARVIWGFSEQRYYPNNTPAGPPVPAGRVEFKNGEVRKFYEADLMVPYVEAYRAAKAKHEAREARLAAEHVAAIEAAAALAQSTNWAYPA